MAAYEKFPAGAEGHYDDGMEVEALIEHPEKVTHREVGRKEMHHPAPQLKRNEMVLVSLELVSETRNYWLSIEIYFKTRNHWIVATGRRASKLIESCSSLT
jgi:hypothetical protein